MSPGHLLTAHLDVERIDIVLVFVSDQLFTQYMTACYQMHCGYHSRGKIPSAAAITIDMHVIARMTVEFGISAARGCAGGEEVQD